MTKYIFKLVIFQKNNELYWLKSYQQLRQEILKIIYHLKFIREKIYMFVFLNDKYIYVYIDGI